jgi:hypothetical protein
MADAAPVLTARAAGELGRLPARAREAIRTWFHGPCLNAAEFAYDVCSAGFAKRLAACRTEELKEQCLLAAFAARIASEIAIRNAVRAAAAEAGAALDRNWADCYRRVAAAWGDRLRADGPAPPPDVAAAAGPLVRERLHEAIRLARAAGERPAVSEVLSSLGTSALLVLRVRAHPLITLPVFVLLALRPLFGYVLGALDTKVGDYQRAISERLAALGNDLGDWFAAEVRVRVEHLHSWQEGALRGAAAARAREAVPVLGGPPPSA